jgi:hypothetical protein
MLTLSFLVFTISASIALCLLVLRPTFPGICDVIALPLLCTTAQQKDHAFSIPAKVNAIARSEVQAEFENSASNGLRG